MFLARLLFALGSLAASVSGLSCLNQIGQPVDSWLAIKSPAGTSSFYYDSESRVFGPSLYSLNDTEQGALAYTTKQLWSSEAAAYVLYNDEVPGETSYSYTYGHTKGFLGLAEDSSGFLLIHSVPSFPLGPQNSSSYKGLGSNAWTYAQNFLCLSVNGSILDAVAYKFLLNRPHIYNSVISPGLATQYKNISALIQGGYSKAAICSYQTLATVGGMAFDLFAKSTQWNKDLWDACVAPAYKSDVLVESWIRGSAEGPDCPTSGYDTLDVQGLDFGFVNGSWSETQDHSKWGLAINASRVCFGDINRMTTQYARGGGTACWEDSYMAKVLHAAVTGMDSC